MRANILRKIACVLMVGMILMQSVYAGTKEYPENHFFSTGGGLTNPPYRESTDPEVVELRTNKDKSKVVINYQEISEIKKDQFIPVIDRGYKGSSTALISLSYICPKLNITYTPDVANKKFTLSGKSFRLNKNISVVGKAGDKQVFRGNDKILIDPVHPELKIQLVNGEFFIPVAALYQIFGYYAIFSDHTHYENPVFQGGTIFISDMDVLIYPLTSYYTDYSTPLTALTKGLLQFKPLAVHYEPKGTLGSPNGEAWVRFLGIGYGALNAQMGLNSEESIKYGKKAELLAAYYNDLKYPGTPPNLYENEYRARRMKEILYFYLGDEDGRTAYYKLNDYFFGVTKEFKTMTFKSGRKVKAVYNTFPIIEIY